PQGENNKKSNAIQNATSFNNDIASKISSFRSFVSHQIHQHNFTSDQIYNVDQTPVWLDMTPKHTVDGIGTKKVSATIPATSGHEKVTVVLACRSDGYKLPPVIVVKSGRK